MIKTLEEFRTITELAVNIVGSMENLGEPWEFIWGLTENNTPEIDQGIRDVRERIGGSAHAYRDALDDLVEESNPEERLKKMLTLSEIVEQRVSSEGRLYGLFVLAASIVIAKNDVVAHQELMKSIFEAAQLAYPAGHYKGQ